MERTGDRLGGCPSVSSLAPNPARPQSQRMRNKHLSPAERIELEAALRKGDTQALVAARLGRWATGMKLRLASSTQRSTPDPD